MAKQAVSAMEAPSVPAMETQEVLVSHLVGCPGGRTEVFDAAKPSGQPVTIARCIECGGSNVKEK